MRTRTILAAAIWAVCPIGWAQIEVPAEVNVGDPIVCSVNLQDVPDGAVIKGTVSPDIPGARVEPGPAANVFHVWAKPGSYDVEVLGMWGVKHPSVEGAWSDFGFFRYRADFKVLGAIEPPQPPPIVNPYQPAPQYQAAAEPVKSLSLSRADAKTLAAMYATAASQARAGAYKNLGQVRADLVRRGSALGLKGKYSGLAPAVDQYLTTCLGLEELVPAASVGEALETLAWAVYESGKVGR